MTEDPYRLSRHVVPSHYRIRLEPDLAAATFVGSEEIAVEVIEPTSTITLNAAELEIYEAHLRNANDDHVEATVAYDEELQRAILTLDQEISPGDWQLFIGFTGILNDQLHGFYRSTFTDVDGNEQVIATTQFESTDARRAFPCWDEPDFKASYGVTLVVPDDLLAVSNGLEIERIAMGEGKVAVTFANTMVMSTYLVAFIVGAFEATEAVDAGGVPLRVIAPKGKQHLTEYAVECGVFALNYLADYYGIPYPGDKMDMVAIPDFGGGAMENLGCVTYRETALLTDLETATTGELLRILDVVAHELAHMWFGDLVTMKWWNGIWLNEAFATFVEMKVTDARRPEWKRWLAFAADERPWAFKVDDLASTRPVEFEVYSPDDAQAMFDALTYGKGSAVLRMLEQFIGEQPFRDGVGSYLRQHSYANTETEDLWAALDEASGQPVGEIMDTWITQGGYPQLDVSAAEDGVTVSQRRFLLTPDADDTTQWKLPVHVRGMADGSPFSTKLLLDRPSATIPVEGAIDWVVANAGGHGFYRTSYGAELFNTLIDDLAALEPVERYTVIDDAWAFVECGQLPAAAFLDIALRFEHETEQSIWSALLAGATAINHHLVSDADRSLFEDWVIELAASGTAKLGWEPKPGESDLIRRLRGQLLGAMGRLANHGDTVERAREVYAQSVADRLAVDPEVAQAAMFTVAAHGDAATFGAFLERHKDAASPHEALRYLQALASFDDEGSVDRLLDLVEDGTVRSQDSSWVLARMFTNRKSGPYAWTRVTERWDVLHPLIPPGTESRLSSGFPALSQPEVAAGVTEFLEANPLRQSVTAVIQKLERMRAMTAMRAREGRGISTALNARTP